MRGRTLLLLAVLALVSAVSAQAADVTGKWIAQVPGRDGQTRETTFNFKVDGDKLTGTMSGRDADIPLQDGKVQGDAISFVVVRSFGGNEMKISYKGKVAGDEIKFTSQREGSDQAREFTANRAK
jgi:hypothetical protein